jgi:amino acid adenylation domain-containing protein
MPLDSNFSCFSIGRESFLIPCCEALLARNCQILGIISTGNSIDLWAKLHGIPLIAPTADIKEFLSTQPFDYLFSISNLKILTPEILALPRRGAINCHDALLPKYGGMNAPSWAILNDERVHGITWHQIATLIDSGDILKQVSFDLDAKETAVSLNTKCYEIILDSFDRLLVDLIAGSIVPIAQNLATRSYFRRDRKPSPGCILKWDWTAEQIDRTLRALTFGPYENFIGSLKLLLPQTGVCSSTERLIIVTKVEVTTNSSQSLPGTIVSIDSDRLTIATASSDLQLVEVKTLVGRALTIATLSDRFQLQVGDRFTDLDPIVSQQLDRFEAKLVRNENFWVERLAKLNPLSVPYGSNKKSAVTTVRSQDWHLPTHLLDFSSEHCPTSPLPKFLFVALVTFFARISHQNCFDIGLRTAELDRQLAQLPDLFAAEVPCRIEIDEQCSFLANFEEIVRQLTSVTQQQTHTSDLGLRYPELQGIATANIAECLPICIQFAGDLDRADHLARPGLTFAISERGDTLRCYYTADSIDRALMTELLARFNVFLDAIAREPRRSLASTPLLSERELQAILVDWNDTQADYPQAKCLHQLVEAQVELTPDAIAVSHYQQQLTYRELNNRANQLAEHLGQLGVKADVLVGICVERSIDTIVGILGILKAGGAYVPLDPAYPQERLAVIIADAKISVLLTQSPLLTELPAHNARVVCLDRDLATAAAQQSIRNPIADVTPDNLAYVIYTSGSTGTPKGVLVEHRAVVNYTTAAKIAYQTTSADRILQFTSLNFDVSAEEIYTCLTAGATLVIRTDGMLESIGTFLDKCQEWAITVASLPTAYWHELTARLEVDRLTLPSSLRLVVIGGEQAMAARLRAWHRAVGTRIRLINAYGPTEGTISALMCDLSELAPDCEIPIGRPIANMQAYVLDRHHQPCPVGVSGELHLGGVGLARGYLDRPELTAAKFIANPLELTAIQPPQRLYKTGDLVKYLPDGQLQFVGRIDTQVKIRGFRVELGEIETRLNDLPDIQEAIVTASTDAGGQQSLVAYVVPKHRDRQLEWWPSVGEYPVYDEMLYHAMTNDRPRNRGYREAIERLVPGQVVVDIGTGKDAILARFCIDAGAKKVYAIESSEVAFKQAIATIERLGLQGKIIPIHGDSTQVDLPELVDVCVSELIGTIGGSEGVAPILNDARRWLKADGMTIPHRCVTKIAAITLPHELLERPGFQDLPKYYAQQIFDRVGRQFDLRLCIKNLPYTSIISTNDVFEDLVFTDVTAIESQQEIDLTITKSARLDGLLLWLNLYTTPDVIIDNLKQPNSWLPVYFPVFYPSIEVTPGDCLSATCRSWLSDDRITPNYQIVGSLIQQNGNVVEFSYDSLHHQQPEIRSPFYELLFPDGELRTIAAGSQLSAKELRAYLRRNLPDYMVPAAFVTLPELPLTPNGKVDRHALPAPKAAHSALAPEFIAPRNATEEILAAIWLKVLGLPQIGIHDNFFDLGGHSLLAVRIFTEIEQQLGKSFPLAILLQQQTIAELAQTIDLAATERAATTDRSQEWESLVTIEYGDSTQPPLFFIHEMSGNVLFYQQLVNYLGSDRHIYGLQPPGLDGIQVPISDVSEMAANYIRDIRKVQPVGPYHLGGYSFGGTVAFEIAQQLHAQGQEIGLLAILDTDAPKVAGWESDPVASSAPPELDLNFSHLTKFLQLNRHERMEYIRNGLGVHRAAGRLRIPYRLYLRYIKRSMLEVGGLDVAWAIHQAYINYVSRSTYPGKVTLFCSSEMLAELPASWNRIVTGGVEVYAIPGTTHITMMKEPHLRLLAERLTFALAKSAAPEIGASAQRFDRVHSPLVRSPLAQSIRSIEPVIVSKLADSPI